MSETSTHMDDHGDEVRREAAAALSGKPNAPWGYVILGALAALGGGFWFADTGASYALLLAAVGGVCVQAGLIGVVLDDVIATRLAEHRDKLR